MSYQLFITVCDQSKSPFGRRVDKINKNWRVHCYVSQQHVSAAVVYKQKHEVEGDLKFVFPHESISLEISTPKGSQVITLLTSTRV